jgi:DNA-binding transcriptional LysR family regulator
MRFDLTDLQLFLNTVEAGSITVGAQRTYIALASASARIRGMEEALGVELLVRGRRGVQPSPAGRTLLQHARIILQQVERMRGDLGQFAQGLKGSVRLVCNTTTLTEYLPEALSAFLALHPNVDIDLRERMSTEIVQDVLHGRADVGILGDSGDTGALETFPFRIDRKALIVSPAHPLAKRRSVAFSETLEHGYVGLAEDTAFQKFLLEQAARSGKRLTFRVRLNSFDALCSMVARNVGLGIIPEAAALRAKKTQDIRVLRLKDEWAERPLSICMRNLAELPLHARELVEHLKG